MAPARGRSGPAIVFSPGLREGVTGGGYHWHGCPSPTAWRFSPAAGPRAGGAETATFEKASNQAFDRTLRHLLGSGRPSGLGVSEGVAAGEWQPSPSVCDGRGMSRIAARAAARRLARTLASAPDPRRQAFKVLDELARASGWGGSEQAAIAEFGLWLAGGPQHAHLKPAVDRLLEKLGPF
jgi:hypothetical protein